MHVYNNKFEMKEDLPKSVSDMNRHLRVLKNFLQRIERAI